MSPTERLRLRIANLEAELRRTHETVAHLRSHLVQMTAERDTHRDANRDCASDKREAERRAELAERRLMALLDKHIGRTA